MHHDAIAARPWGSAIREFHCKKSCHCIYFSACLRVGKQGSITRCKRRKTRRGHGSETIELALVSGSLKGREIKVPVRSQ